MRRYLSEIVISLILVAAGLAVYGQVLSHDFLNLDDDVYITENPYVSQGWHAEGFTRAFTSDLHGHWHPLTWLSHMTDAQLFGLNPGGHHLTSLVFHLASTLLLFFLLRRITGAVYRSAAVAALFAFHPLHAETVAWAADRKDILAGFFTLLTLRAYVAYTADRTLTRYVLALVCFSLALLSKSIAATVPALLLLLDYWPLGRTHWMLAETGGSGDQSGPRDEASLRHLLWEKAGFAVPVILTAIVTISAMEGRQVEDRPLSQWWAADALVNYVTYIRRTLWPTDLTVLYPYFIHVPLWKIVGAGMILLAISIAAILWARRRPYLIVGWLWYLVMLLPVIGVIRAGPHKIADRYTYLPLIGLFIAGVWGVSELAGRRRYRRHGLAVIGAAVIIAVMVGAWHQTRYWKDSESLFSHAVSIYPQSWLAHNNLGDALAEMGDYEGAVRSFRKANRANPRYARTHYNLGNALARA
ncbi:MAG: tetratricopeptide repeat protein, partial [Deltaproteobacteria bacterium]|nr:tetratricopeptide repeat protein [Deltaproteobacteria bacterium]